VFRAKDSQRDRLVAIKVFRLDMTPEQTASLVGQFDALIAAKINHPNIAAPIAAGLEDGVLYLAQEYVSGESLDVILRDRGPLSIDAATPLIDALASAVGHAEARGVRHSALHPRDIILSDEGARITGFGIVDALSGSSAKLPTRPPYSAPEAPSDRYSLGVIAFEALTGKRASPSNVEALKREYAGELPGAISAALEAVGSTFAETPLTATVDKPDLDLRIDHPIALIPEIKPMLDSLDDLTESRSSRWPIVAMFLGFGLLTALTVGFFLRSTDPAATSDSKSGVEETTVELPASSTPSAEAGKPPLPAPAPSRSASGAIARPLPTRGSMLIRSTPADADVLLNGQSRGKTPLVIRDLALGSYTIRVAREGHVSEEQTFQLTAQRPTAATTFNLRTLPASASAGSVVGSSGRMTVQSRPQGARVFVNDRLIGSTPAMIPELPAGPATVRLEMDGYQPWATTVRVTAGAQTRVAASLERK
jgi:serine/threonine protein kinase